MHQNQAILGQKLSEIAFLVSSEPKNPSFMNIDDIRNKSTIDILSMILPTIESMLKPSQFQHVACVF